MSTDTIDKSDIEPAETVEQEIDVNEVLLALVNNTDGQSLVGEGIPPGSIPFAKYVPADDPEDAGHWEITVGCGEYSFRVPEYGDHSDAVGLGRDIAWSFCHAGLLILQLLKRVRDLEAENKRLTISPAARMAVLEQQVADWHEKRYGAVKVGPTTRKLGEEYGELMEALLSGDLDRIEEEAADVALVLTHIVRGVSGGSLSACMARKFDRVLSR